MSRHTPDRRRHQRVNVGRSVLDSREFIANNLSESGMQLSCTTEQRKGRMLELTLKLEDQTMRLKAQVVWCQKAVSVFETGYHVGVQFIGHSASQQLVIRDFVDRNMDGGEQNT